MPLPYNPIKAIDTLNNKNLLYVKIKKLVGQITVIKHFADLYKIEMFQYFTLMYLPSTSKDFAICISIRQPYLFVSGEFTFKL